MKIKLKNIFIIITYLCASATNIFALSEIAGWHFLEWGEGWLWFFGLLGLIFFLATLCLSDE
jgi:hypothetical protein